MDRETEGYHIEGISLLATSLDPGVKHVAEVVQVAQVCLGIAHGLEILKHVAELFTNSLNIVTHGRKNLGAKEVPSWRPAVCKKFSYVDVKI